MTARCVQAHSSPAEPAVCPCKECAEVRARLAGLLQRDTPAEVEARVRLVVHGGPVPPELQGRPRGRATP